MKLFKYEGYKINISEEAILLKPFKLIWNRDRSESKYKALMELGYIYFMTDARSDYQYLVDERDRDRAIRDGEGIPEDWKPDKLIKDAMEFYKSFKSTSALLLEDTRAVIDNVRKTLRKFSFEDMEEKDKIAAIRSVAATIATIPKLIKDLDDAEKAVTSEMQAVSGIVRGQKEKSLFDDGIQL